MSRGTKKVTIILCILLSQNEKRAKLKGLFDVDRVSDRSEMRITNSKVLEISLRTVFGSSYLQASYAFLCRGRIPRTG